MEALEVIEEESKRLTFTIPQNVVSLQSYIIYKDPDTKINEVNPRGLACEHGVATLSSVHNFPSTYPDESHKKYIIKITDDESFHQTEGINTFKSNVLMETYKNNLQGGVTIDGIYVKDSGFKKINVKHVFNFYKKVKHGHFQQQQKVKEEAD